MNDEQNRLMKMLTGKVFEDVTPDEKMELMDMLAIALGGIILEGVRDVGSSVYVKPLQHDTDPNRVGVVIVAEGKDAVFIHNLVTSAMEELGRPKENSDGELPFIDAGKNSTIYH